MKKVLSALAATILFLPLHAQQSDGRIYSLDDCMSYAVEHSPQVKQRQYENANYRQDYIESIASLTPSISASAYGSANYGRSIDPNTNTYTTNANLGNSYSLSASMPLFAGLSGINTVRAAKVMRLMGVEQLQQARDQVALTVMESYFDVVYYTGSSSIARQQLETSRATLEMTRKMAELGLKSDAEVAEVEAQVASDDYLLTQQENNLALARITLQEAMNYPAGDSLAVQTDVPVETLYGGAPLARVIDYASENHPKAVEAEQNVRYNRLRLSVVRGRYYPSLTVGGGYSTNYASPIGTGEALLPFWEQFKGNRGHSFTAQISIPIFGGLTRRANVNRQRNNLRIAEQQREQTLRSLQSEIAQTWQQMQGLGKEYVQATKKSEAAELAHRAVLNKFEQGMVSAIEVQTSANLLMQARSERLRARLQYIIKTRLVEYYNGAPLIR